MLVYIYLLMNANVYNRLPVLSRLSVILARIIMYYSPSCTTPRNPAHYFLDPLGGGLAVLLRVSI